MSICNISGMCLMISFCSYTEQGENIYFFQQTIGKSLIISRKGSFKTKKRENQIVKFLNEQFSFFNIENYFRNTTEDALFEFLLKNLIEYFYRGLQGDSFSHFF